ncbi:MAG TPA: tetratricopeptide repeat protein, partial [Verrucomicrobiae bacterium]
MAFLRQWLLILFALGLSSEQIFAASARENRDYAAAAAAFQDGMYGRADAAFAQFVEKHPKSERVGEAILLQAQAEIKQGDFTGAILLLIRPDNQAKAGPLADEYVYWTGEAQFQGGNFPAAAKTWTALAQQFPDSRLRLQTLVGAAAALTELAEWRQTISLLEATNGIFQRMAQTNPAGELEARGKLFLAQAKFQLKDFTGATAILEPLLDRLTLPPELRWRCGRLLYQAWLAAG